MDQILLKSGTSLAKKARTPSLLSAELKAWSLAAKEALKASSSVTSNARSITDLARRSAIRGRCTSVSARLRATTRLWPSSQTRLTSPQLMGSLRINRLAQKDQFLCTPLTDAPGCTERPAATGKYTKFNF